jgi:hypothetical protein
LTRDDWTIRSSSTRAFNSGYRRSPDKHARASNASTLTGCSGRAALMPARASSNGVASTSTQIVTSGTSRRLRLSFSAAARRTPRSGTTCSPSTTVPAAGAGAGAGAIAASTSARRTIPPGPLPCSVATSTWWSRASFRTSGEMTSGAPPDGTAALTPALGTAALAALGTAVLAAGAAERATAARRRRRPPAPWPVP